MTLTIRIAGSSDPDAGPARHTFVCRRCCTSTVRESRFLGEPESTKVYIRTRPSKCRCPRPRKARR